MTTKKQFKVEIYQDRKKEWRWRYVASNGRVIATSGEGYLKRGNLDRALERFATVFDPSLFRNPEELKVYTPRKIKAPVRKRLAHPVKLKVVTGKAA